MLFSFSAKRYLTAFITTRRNNNLYDEAICLEGFSIINYQMLSHFSVMLGVSAEMISTVGIYKKSGLKKTPAHSEYGKVQCPYSSPSRISIMVQAALATEVPGPKIAETPAL